MMMPLDLCMSHNVTCLVCADARELPGQCAPFGYFDPLGLAAETTPEQVKRYREAELTHGRVCMLAALGFLVGEAVQDKTLFYNWDGNINGIVTLCCALRVAAVDVLIDGFVWLLCSSNRRHDTT